MQVSKIEEDNNVEEEEFMDAIDEHLELPLDIGERKRKEKFWSITSTSTVLQTLAEEETVICLPKYIENTAVKEVENNSVNNTNNK